MVGKRTVILCAGYHSHIVAEILRLREGFELIGILDDNEDLHKTCRNGFPVLGGLSLLRGLKDAGRVDGAALGLGNLAMLRRRIEIYQVARSHGIEMVQVVHPTAFVSPTAVCGPGLLLGSLAVISVGIHVGENVVIHAASTVGHDSEIGDHVFISPGVHTAGQVKIERRAYIGPGAVISSGCVVGEGAVIGAGSVVIKDIPGGKLAFGVPARVQKSVEEWEKEFAKKQ
jgi:acetyltransferase EpsM